MEMRQEYCSTKNGFQYFSDKARKFKYEQVDSYYGESEGRDRIREYSTCNMYCMLLNAFNAFEIAIKLRYERITTTAMEWNDDDAHDE